MTIELFSLCDGAYNYNGKLTIVGTLASLSPTSLPVRIKIGVAMRIRVENGGNGEQVHPFRIGLPSGTHTSIPVTDTNNVEFVGRGSLYRRSGAGLRGQEPSERAGGILL